MLAPCVIGLLPPSRLLLLTKSLPRLFLASLPGIRQFLLLLDVLDAAAKTFRFVLVLILSHELSARVYM